MLAAPSVVLGTNDLSSFRSTKETDPVTVIGHSWEMTLTGSGVFPGSFGSVGFFLSRRGRSQLQRILQDVEPEGRPQAEKNPRQRDAEQVFPLRHVRGRDEFKR